MITTTPSPRDLGLHSPVIGPWFDVDTVQLGLADADLAVPLSLAASREWRPPVAGILSLYISTPARPAGLARLRSPTGPAFDDNHLVACYEVLPEAGQRLAALMRQLPSLAGAASPTRPTRPSAHTFALEFTQASVDDALVLGLFPDLGFPPGLSTPADKLAYLGLSLDSGMVGNGAAPMRDLFRPGVTGGTSQKLLKLSTAQNVRLWAFDERGLAIDPGAVACWWHFLGSDATQGINQLYADGVDTRTAPIAAGADRLTVHLVNAHEGPLDATTRARVQTGSNVQGTGNLLHRGAGSDPVALSFTAAPASGPDDLPAPRMGVLPDGRLGSTVSLFAAGPLAPALNRDQARVAVLSMEHHLIGQPRHSAAGANAVAARRAADQERATTRVLVDRAAPGALLGSPVAVAQAALATWGLQDAGTPVNAQAALPALDVDWGVPAGPALPDVPPPPVSPAPTLTARALTGGGTAAGGTVAGQRILLDIDVGAALAGAWVRVWGQAIDLDTGTRRLTDGAAARVDTAGVAHALLSLPDGDVAPPAPLGVQILLVTLQGTRLWADARFDRPAPIGGSPVAAGSATGPFLLPEEGRSVPALDASTQLQAGSQVVAMGGASPALVDRSTLPLACRAAGTWARSATAGDALRLTPGAFKNSPAGDADAALTATGATVRRSLRQLPNAWQAGQPLPGQERREWVVAATNGNVARAVVSGGPALASRVPQAPHAQAHPLSRAGADVWAVGAQLQGPIVRAVAEYARERVSQHTVDLAVLASTPLASPAAAPTDTLWVAGLRTVAAGVEAEFLTSQLVSLSGSAYPFGQALTDIQAFLSGLPGSPTLPASVQAAAQEVVRALDRRFLAATYGAREAAVALAAAIGRAEDFIYIETPALDDRGFGQGDDAFHLLDALAQRLSDRPGLRLLLCLPVFLDDSVPRPLQRVRDAECRAAIDRLLTGREDRVAVFSPTAGPGRTLKLATTAVVVDDAWALVGSTHLWRRGLSHDSSYAVALTDERLLDGRPQEVITWRRQLCADRLGLTLAELPDTAPALVDAVRLLVDRGGLGRLAADRLRLPPEADSTVLPASTFTEADVWNPDGSLPADPTGFNPVTWALSLTPTAVTEGLATP